MKLLAIRGCNLASLAGEFEVDLENGPLGPVGLFAITGPTGSGKSTILDAMCLALYGKTPRLTDRGGVKVGSTDEERQEGLASNDARSLLRRGAKEAWAQVDFVGGDKQRYTSKWSVRRARSKATGKPQGQSMELTRQSDGARLGGTLTETRAEIEAKVGLTFEQFKRSVLLAQGDFAAFLKASADERAELLEKMTQTQRYGEISKRVYQRATEEAGKLRELALRKESLGSKSAEERAELEAALQQAREALEGQQVRLAGLQADGRWYGQMDKLEQDVLTGARTLEALQEGWNKSEGARTELATLLRLRELRPTVESYDKAHASLLQCQSELALAHQKHLDLQASRTHCLDEHAQATSRLLEATTAIEAAKPDLLQARSLDERVASQTELKGQSETAKSLALQGLKAAVQKHTQVQKEAAAAQVQAQTAMQWLASHQPDQALAGQWPLVQSALQRLETLRQDAVVCENRRNQALVQRDLHQEALAGNQTRLQDATAALAFARTAQTSTESQAPSESQKEAFERKELLEERQRRFRRGQEMLELGRQLTTEATLGDAARQDVLAQIGLAKQALAQSVLSVTRLEGSLEEAQRSELEASRAADLAQHRAALEEGRPCPLCGSMTHPWASGQAASAELGARQKRRADLQTALKAAQSEHTLASNRLASLETKAAQCTQEFARLVEARQAHSNEWTGWLQWAAGQGIQGFDQTQGPEAGEVLQTLTEQVGAELPRVKKVLEDWQRYQEAVTKARAESDRLSHAERKLQAEVERAKESLAAKEKELAAAQAELTGVTSSVEEVCKALAGPLLQEPGWTTASANELASLRANLWKRVVEWQNQETARQVAEQRVASLSVEQARAQAAEVQAQADVDRLQGAATAIDDELASLAALRSTLLQGQTVAAVELRLDQERTAAQLYLTQKQTAVLAMEKALSAAAALIEELQRRLGQLQSELDASSRDLDLALEGRGVLLPEVRTALGREAAQIDGLVATMRREQEALEKARTVLEERQRAREFHQQTNRPELSREELARLSVELEAGLPPLKHQEEEARLALRRVDEARQQAADLEQQIEAQTAIYRPWGQLNECIGSADGKKFRRFAQGLTLDALLAHANRHLHELASRYLLLRVQGEELELQVLDRDMGDEIRTINSLSGGETFLASLALALGLASLASRKTLVESLFIDEGFGTLDPETLESALGVLDGLQATGRKVGIISHVPGLAAHIGARVEIRRQGQGRSEVVTLGAQ